MISSSTSYFIMALFELRLLFSNYQLPLWALPELVYILIQAIVAERSGQSSPLVLRVALYLRLGSGHSRKLAVHGRRVRYTPIRIILCLSLLELFFLNLIPRATISRLSHRLGSRHVLHDRYRGGHSLELHPLLVPHLVLHFPFPLIHVRFLF